MSRGFLLGDGIADAVDKSDEEGEVECAGDVGAVLQVERYQFLNGFLDTRLGDGGLQLGLDGHCGPGGCVLPSYFDIMNIIVKGASLDVMDIRTHQRRIGVVGDVPVPDSMTRWSHACLRCVWTAGISAS